MTKGQLDILTNAVAKGMKMEGIDIDDRPTAVKEGFIIVPKVLDATHLAWEYVEDPNYHPSMDGSYLHPFQYEAGMEVIAEKWYTNGEDIWEAIATGTPNAWEDPAYFDVVTV